VGGFKKRQGKGVGGVGKKKKKNRRKKACVFKNGAMRGGNKVKKAAWEKQKGVREFFRFADTRGGDHKIVHKARNYTKESPGTGSFGK